MRLDRRKNRGFRNGTKRPSGDGRGGQPRSAPRDAGRHAGGAQPPGPDEPLLRAGESLAADALGIVLEMVRWPARIWMAVAEALGASILLVWRRAALPVLRVARRLLRSALAWGEREVTPARGLAAVAVVATIALGGSQFGDYRGIEVGTPEYARVQGVAPAPQVDRAMPRSAHGVSVFAIAVACLFVILFAACRNWRRARLLSLAGISVVAISLFVDRPDGLRLGTTGDAYVGAHAVLLGPFWVQLSAGAALAFVGPLLAAQPRSERAVRRRRAAGRRDEEAQGAPRLRPGVGT